MRRIALALVLVLSAASSLGCPPKDVPDPPAVGASAKDGQKARQPDPPRSLQDKDAEGDGEADGTR